ncbi:hypothetical protein BGX31_003905 [Mortierella sp. GBA43]|nr:hypothetical protein BGX31_003905 [Mortierella sp. GBA43]
MSDSDLALPTIVPLLQHKPGAAAAKPEADSRPTASSSSQSDASIAQHPHLVPASLKVETALLTKELAKFRACDQGTCFYCREWAQWVFKKTFGKDKDKDKDKGSSGADKKGGRLNGPAGSGTGNTSGSGSETKKKHKEYAMVVCERFYQRAAADHAIATGGRCRPLGATSGAGSVAAAAIAASKAGTGTGPAPSVTGSAHEGFVSEIIDTVRDWIQQPSALYTSPEVFSLIDFEALYAANPLLTQEENHQQDDVTPILATITIEKAHMILGHHGYPLLKRVTKAQLQNQIMNPTCQHTKGHSKNPADLELEKDLFNEELKKMRMRDQEGLRKQIGPVWKHVEEVLERMEGAEKVRSGILGPSRAKEFAQTYKDRLASFQEVWGGIETAVKKPTTRKKGATSDSTPSDPVEEVDRGFQQFITNMQYVHNQLVADVLESSERSLREFIKELAAAQTKILKLALTRIQEGKVGTARIDKILEESPEKCRNALKMVEQLVPIFDTKMGQFRVLVLNKLKEVDEEVELVAAAYFQDSQKTVQGRLEKAANKDFRKRIKKLEFLSMETRKWFFQSRLTLFSSLDFATVCLNTLGILMEEAEVLEAVQLGLHDDHFRSRVLKSQEGRIKLTQQFKEGVKTGRRVLAVMVSRLMMREGARAMGEMAAIQKEKKFLKSLGQDVGDTRLNTRGFLVPHQDVTPTASAHGSDDEDADDAPGTSTVSKNKKKKEKKKKKAAEAAAAAAAAGITNDTSDASMSSGAVSGLVRNSVAEPLTAISSKEAREQKKQAKKDAKRQLKEAVDAEAAAAAQLEAKKAQEEQKAREMKEALEAIERQEAKELKEREEAELGRQKRAAEEALEAEAAEARKAAEEAEARRKARELKELAEAYEKERAQKLKEEAQQAKLLKEAMEKERAQKAKESQQAKNKQAAKETNPSQKSKDKQAKTTKSTTEESAPQKTMETQPVTTTQDVEETATLTEAPKSTPSATGWGAAPEKAAPASGWDDKPKTESTTGWDTKREEPAAEATTLATGWGEKPKTTASGWGPSTTGAEEKKTSTWDEEPKTTSAWGEKPKTATSGWGSSTTGSDEKKTAWGEEPKTTSGWSDKPKTTTTSGWGSSATGSDEKKTTWGEEPKATSGWGEKPKKTSWDEQRAQTPSAWGSSAATSEGNTKSSPSERASTTGKDTTTSSELAAPATSWGEPPKTTSSVTSKDEKPKAPSSEQANSATGWDDKPATTTSGWGSTTATTTTTESTGWGEAPATTASTSGWSSSTTTKSTGWGEKPVTTTSERNSSSSTTTASTSWGEKPTAPRNPAAITTSWTEKPTATSSERTSSPTTAAGKGEEPVVTSSGWDSPTKVETTGWGEKPAATSSGWKSSTTETTGWGEKPSETSSGWSSSTTSTAKSTGWGEKPATATSDWDSPSTGWGEKSAGLAPEWSEKPPTSSSEWGSSTPATTGWDEKPAVSSEWSSSSASTSWGEKPATTSSDWNASAGWDSTPTTSSWDAPSESRGSSWGRGRGRGMDRGRGAPGKRYSEDRGQRGIRWNDLNEPRGRYNNNNSNSNYNSNYNNNYNNNHNYNNNYNSNSNYNNNYNNNDAPAHKDWRNNRQKDSSSFGSRDGDQPSTTESGQDESGMDSVEDLSRLPAQALVSLVRTLQTENKSLLSTLVSMQQQVSSLTERYTTLASLAREHEQQAIQAMESQKQREMEEVQRHVWKVEERCRQLEKHALATHQRMQQMQFQQQQQQQQTSLSSGPPGLTSTVGSIPPGFSNLIGISRQTSAPTSPSLTQRNLNGMESPTSPSFSGSPMVVYPIMTSSTNGSMDSLMSPVQAGTLHTPTMSSAPVTIGGAPPGFESIQKKYWRQRGEIRCGNCAELGHSSTDCQRGCRYCDKEGHLSQDCPKMTSSRG